MPTALNIQRSDSASSIVLQWSTDPGNHLLYTATSLLAYSAQPMTTRHWHWHRHSLRCLAPVLVWHSIWLRKPLFKTAIGLAAPALPWPRHSRVSSFSTALGCRSLYSAPQTHQRQRHCPRRSPRCLATKWVWHSFWLRKPVFRTVTALAAPALAQPLPCEFGTAFGSGSLYSECAVKQDSDG